MPEFVIELLGAPTIHRNGNDVTPKRRKTMALLAYLVAEPRRHSRARLAPILWPDSGDARKLLRHAVYELKQCLGSDAVRSDQDRLWIDQGIITCCDINQLRHLADTGNVTTQPPSPIEVEKLCSGEFLEGIAFDDCDVLEEWVYGMREQLAHNRRRFLERLVAFHRTRGNNDTALALLERWQQLDRLDEGVCQQRIQLYMHRGEPRQAERVFNSYRKALSDELGISPSPDLIALLKETPEDAIPTAPVEDRTQATPETHYLKSGSVFIAYQTLGAGPDTLVVINGFMSHLEQVWENPNLARFYRQLAENVQLVLFDKRGSGMSDRVAHVPTPAEIADDVHCLVTALGRERVSLFGFSEGGAAAVEFAVRYPGMTDQLVLYGTAARWTRDDDYRPALTHQQFDQWREKLIHHWGRGVSIREFAPSQAQEPAVVDWWAKTMRLSSSPGEVARILRSIRDIDLRSELPQIQCPTLILHKTDDRVVHFAAAEDLAERIPRARLLRLRGRDHWFWTEDLEKVLGLIQDTLLNATR